jgi:predicted nucleotidyltransferase
MSLEQTIDLNQILHDRLKVSQDAIAQFCQKWKIVEFALFGSVLRDDFRDDSDLDVLVVFEEPRDLSLSAWLDIREEISVLFGRKVDLIQKKLLKNPYSRAEILRTHRVIYASK